VNGCEIRLGTDACAVDAFRPLWEAVTEHHASLRLDDSRGMLPTWEGERGSLVRALDDRGAGFVVVAEDADELVGYARVALGPGGLTVWPPVDRIGKLETLSVTPSRRDRGVGTRLVEAAIAELARRGVTIVFVAFWRENTSAQRFYERHGFRADARGRFRRSCS
jgi:ribosomal protein S18 acetylase RimI-like enzyme